VAFPTLKELTEVFDGNEEIVFLAVQTVLEGYTVNTDDKLQRNQEKIGPENSHGPCAGE